MSVICPNCQAVLGDASDSSVELRECPSCGVDISHLATQRDLEREFGAAGDSPLLDGASTTKSAAGTFEILEQSDSRLAIRIPPGGPRTGSGGCLAVFWLIFVGCATPFAIREVVAGKKEWLVLPIIGAFWLVGLGLAYWWARMRFTRMVVLLEPGKVVVQRNFLGRRWLKQAELTPNSRASFKEAYRENKKPIYTIVIHGKPIGVTFGMGLPPDEMNGLVDTINTFFDKLDTRARRRKIAAEMCPACGADLPHIQVELQDATIRCPACRDVLPPPDTNTEIELPVDSQVQVVEQGPERMVVYIPPGGTSTKAIGLFALAWNVFMMIFTPIWIVAEPDKLPPFGVILFLLFFWLIGLMLIWIWVNMRFSKTFLLLESDRMVVQKVLWGRKSLSESSLGPKSRASLWESFRQNDEPVYEVSINGPERRVHFGTALSQEEKDWFVASINQFLGRENRVIPRADDLPEICPGCSAALEACLFDPESRQCYCPQCDAQLASAISSDDDDEDDAPEHVVEVNPAALPVDSEIVVTSAEPERLSFHLALLPAGKVRRVIGWLAVVAALVVAVMVAMDVKATVDARAAGNNDYFEIVFNFVDCLAAGVPLALFLGLLLGRIWVDVDSATLRCRWQCFRIGPKRQFPVHSIDRIAVTRVKIERPEHERRKGYEFQGTPIKGCLVESGSSKVPLTTFHSTRTAKQVAGLLLSQLRRLGITPRDV